MALGTLSSFTFICSGMRIIPPSCFEELLVEALLVMLMQPAEK